MKGVVRLREGDARARVIVHMGTCGIAAGARDVMAALMEAVEKRGLADVLVSISGCAGVCGREPMMTVQLQDQPPVTYVDMTPKKAVEVLEKHVIGGKPIREYALAVGD